MPPSRASGCDTAAPSVGTPISLLAFPPRTGRSCTRTTLTPRRAAEIAALYNIRLYTIGVGTKGLAPYPFRDAFGRKRYQNVPVELDENLLTQMAQSTNDGQYFRATNKKSLQQIFNQIDKMEKSKIDVTQYSQTKDEYQGWLILAALALLLEILLGLFYFRSTP